MIVPGAIVKLIPKYNQKRMVAYKRVNLHVAVAIGESLYNAFNNDNACSHFYVRKNGKFEQYIDTQFASSADYKGNPTTISIETEGGVVDANREPWTPEQLKTLAYLFATLRAEHNIANKLF